ncbi:MAG: 1-acyl-sn-glycerol-3-phosphate acyltransferase [Rhodospirillaceae bacterium]|jgi:1-acyl-sn-glycerol-3-phosphate acyltransferase|nr:1-acyl-sn-glycerol-3-phosphate acyltransferase [Rhodospirillaceae bacterium]
MIVIRSLAYQLIFLSWTTIISISCLPLLAIASRHTMQNIATFWIKICFFLQRKILQMSFEIRGIDNLPHGSVIIAAKHQSIWDTMIFHHLLTDPAYIFKKELLFVPIIGWYLQKTGQIPIDRNGGIKALKLMINMTRHAVTNQQQIVIFPEGHRQLPGITGTYHSGVAMLYKSLKIPVVPVALNSGLFWCRQTFLRYPGVITLEILPALPDNIERKTLMKVLQDQIEIATYTLEKEALQRFSYLNCLISH